MLLASPNGPTPNMHITVPHYRIIRSTFIGSLAYITLPSRLYCTMGPPGFALRAVGPWRRIPPRPCGPGAGNCLSRVDLCGQLLLSDQTASRIGRLLARPRSIMTPSGQLGITTWANAARRSQGPRAQFRYSYRVFHDNLHIDLVFLPLRPYRSSIQTTVKACGLPPRHPRKSPRDLLLLS